MIGSGVIALARVSLGSALEVAVAMTVALPF
jgi:hypothetical protein